MKRFGFLVLLCTSLSGCAASPVAPQERADAEQRLLRPFAVAREVGCSELVIEMTANFAANVGRPAADPARHQVRTRHLDGCSETEWLNPTGLPEAAFLVTVGPPMELTNAGWVQPPRTMFRVVQRLVLRVFEGRHALALDAAATGVVVVKDADAPLRDAASFVVRDGVVR